MPDKKIKKLWVTRPLGVSGRSKLKGREKEIKGLHMVPFLKSTMVWASWKTESIMLD